MANFIFVTPQVVVARNASALYGVKLGSVNMPIYAVMAGTTPDNLLNSVYVNSVGSASTGVVADVLIANLGISGAAAIATAKNFIVAQLDAAPVATRGAVVNGLLDLFSKLTDDATYGPAATAWNNRIADAVVYSSIPGNADVAFGTSNFALTASIDNIVGSAADDVFNAYILDNQNTLQSGDTLDGGAGNDTLFADMASSASFAVTPHLTNIEKVSIRAEATQFDPTNGNNTSGQGGVTIDAQRAASVTTWESSNSRSDVIIEDVRTNSNVTTVAFVESDPGNVDLGVYFNERNLVNTTSGTSLLNILLMDTAAAVATPTTPLLNNYFNSFTFFANDVKVILGGAGTDAGAAIDAATNYADLLAAFQLALKTALVGGVVTDLSTSVVASLSAVQDMTTAAGSSAVAASFLHLNGQVLSLTAGTTVAITEASSTGEKGGWAASGIAPTTGSLVQTINAGSSSAAALVSTSIILDDVGLGDTGGDLVVGGMSTGVTSNDNGVQLFNIEVRDNSKLQTINSTNNTLREVNIVNGATTSSSTAYVTTVKDAGNLTVNGTNFVNLVNDSLNVNGTITQPVYVVDTPLAGTGAVLGTNQTIGHSINGSAGFTDVRLINAAAMTGKFEFTAAITSDSILKYHNLIDTQANPTGDVATANVAGLGANFIYTGGLNNDTMNVAIDATVASSRSTIVPGQSDFTFALNGGAGDDAITLALQGAGLAGGAQAWYTNQKLNANINIDGGDGNDTIRTPGAGDVIINGGAGNDTIYTDNTGDLSIPANATGFAGPAAVAYTNAAAAELAAVTAAGQLANSTALFNALNPLANSTFVLAGLNAIDATTPNNLTIAPVYPTYAAVAGIIAGVYGAGLITAEQKIALDVAYNAITAETVVDPVTLAAFATFAGGVAHAAGAMSAADAAAGDALLATYQTATKAAIADATAANADLGVELALLDPTQLAVYNATLAMNRVYDGDLAIAPGTTTIVNGLAALQSALVLGATDANVVAALNTATKSGVIALGADVLLFGAAVATAGTMDAAEVAAVTAILSPLQNTAAINNTVAATALAAAVTANTTAVNTVAQAVAAAPTGFNPFDVSPVGGDEAGSLQAAAAAAAAATAATKAAVDVTDAAAVNAALATLKATVNVGSLDAVVTNAVDNAAAAVAAAVADSVANGNGSVVNVLTAPVIAALEGFAGVGGGALGVIAAEEVTFDTGAGGYLAPGSVDSLILANTATLDALTSFSAKAAATAAATATASTIATAAANSGTNSLTLPAPKAVFVFDTSNQAASYNRLTQDDRNLADLKSDANDSYNFFNSTVKVTYKGIDASIVVAGGTDFKTTDLQINQALKLAINNDAVLSKLLLAVDGPANTLVVTSLIDGVQATADLAVTVTLPTTAGSNIAAAAASYGLPVGSTDAAVLTAMNTAKGLFDTKGDYTTQFAESGAAGGNVTLTGANSVSSSDNTITGGTGNDVIVLGTTVGTDVLTSSNETVKFAADFGNDTVVHFAATGLGIDKLDFSALKGLGSAFGSVSADKSIVIGAPTATPLTAVEIAALFTDSATAINHVYVEVNSTNIGSVYTVADAAGTAAGNVVATLTGTIDLADTAWGTLTAANFA